MWCRTRVYRLLLILALAFAAGTAVAAQTPSARERLHEEAICAVRGEASRARCAETASRLRERARQLGLTRCFFRRGGFPATKGVALYAAKSRIYVHPDWTDEQRRSHFALYSGRIGPIIDEVNAIFREPKINIFIVNLFTLPVADAGMVIADLNSFGPTGEDLESVTIRGQREFDRIQLHWSERSSSTVLAYGGRPAVPPYVKTNWIGMADNNFRTKSVKLLAQTLAHEIGHYFRLTHVDQDDNLMFQGAREDRTALTEQQRRIMVSAAHNNRRHLDALTCVKPTQ